MSTELPLMPQDDRASYLHWLASLLGPIFPCHSIRADGRCSFGEADCEKSTGKHPRVKWTKQAATDLDQIQAWCEKWPEANWAVVTGQVIVLDCDSAEGLACVEQLEFNAGQRLPDTLRVSSGRGCHIYLRLPDGI